MLQNPPNNLGDKENTSLKTLLKEKQEQIEKFIMLEMKLNELNIKL